VITILALGSFRCCKALVVSIFVCHYLFKASPYFFFPYSGSCAQHLAVYRAAIDVATITTKDSRT
jgi:hypothetical protein